MTQRNDSKRMNKTTLQDCINRVVDYQKWRRGDEDLSQPNPTELGADLDELIKAAQSYADLPEKVMGLQTYLLSETQSEILIDRDDILTLLENQND